MTSFYDSLKIGKGLPSVSPAPAGVEVEGASSGSEDQAPTTPVVPSTKKGKKRPAQVDDAARVRNAAMGGMNSKLAMQQNCRYQ